MYIINVTMFSFVLKVTGYKWGKGGIISTTIIFSFINFEKMLGFFFSLKQKSKYPHYKNEQNKIFCFVTEYFIYLYTYFPTYLKTIYDFGLSLYHLYSHLHSHLQIIEICYGTFAFKNGVCYIYNSFTGILKESC